MHELTQTLGATSTPLVRPLISVGLVVRGGGLGKIMGTGRRIKSQLQSHMTRCPGGQYRPARGCGSSKGPRNPRACAVRPRSTHHAGLGLHWGPLLLPQPRAGRYWPPGHRVICDCSWDLMRLPVPMILPKPPPRYRSLVIARIDTNPWCHKHPLGSPVDIRWACCAVAPL